MNALPSHKWLGYSHRTATRKQEEPFPPNTPLKPQFLAFFS
jgi:hypothetical protein